MALKIPSPIPVFPSTLTPSRPNGAAPTELRFSRWNNANAESFVRRRREQQEIEDDIRRQRRHHSAASIAKTLDPASASPPPAAAHFKSRGTPSSPSSPSIPGKASKYSKPPKPPKSPPHPAFRRRVGGFPPPPPSSSEAGITVGDRGISYRVKDAPFEFQYSYTETPKVRPLALREPPFLPFGPDTMPRPWTGRAPLPASKKKIPEFDSFKLPPPGKKGVKPVQAPGPFLAGSGPKHAGASREEILGDPLAEEEVKEMIKGSLKTRRQLNMGRDGLTHNMLDNIHAHWKRKRVCKIKCMGVCTVDMDNVRQQLEEKTGGKIIYNRGGVIYLFRGRNYNYRTRPRYPLMLWKPITPVYPRLVQHCPEGLTLEEATEMRNKGHKLPPICKLGKNGLYSGLVQHVREAFEECEMVQINCKDMNNSDCRKIGAKLKDLVPCVLLSFAYEHILMWRGKDWKSSLPQQEDDPVVLVADSPTTTSPDISELGVVNFLNDLDLELLTEKVTPVEDLVTEETEVPSSSESIDGMLSIPEREAQVSSASFGGGDLTRLENNEAAARTEMISMDRVKVLLRQAVESGSAVVLDEGDLDASIVLERSVALARTAPPGPVFQQRIRKTVVQKTQKVKREKYSELDVDTEVISLPIKEKRGSEKKISKIRRREDLKVLSDGAPHGSLRVDELAKLLT